MLQPIPLDDAEQFDLIPQAILKHSVSYLAELLGTRVTKTEDDLDSYEGAGLLWTYEGIDRMLLRTPVVIKHYRGEPKGTATILLSRGIVDIHEITKAVRAIVVEEFGLPLDSIAWQRRDSPDL